MMVKTCATRALRAIRDERGFGLSAIMTVFGVMVIMTLLALALLPLAEDETTATNREIMKTESLFIAEAGLNDYIWHLNQNENYYKETTHTAQGVDGSGVNNWQTYQDGKYHLNITPLESSPGVVIESIGQVQQNDKTVMRKVQATIQKRSFTQYLYFSNYETLVGSNTIVWFITGDRIRGPMHSNDDININGNPVFEQEVTTAEQIEEASGSNPDFQEGYTENVPPITMPRTNEGLRTEAQSNGYYYSGRTSIFFNASGTVNINNGSPKNALSTGPTGNGLALPANGVIYVDGQTLDKDNATRYAENGDAFVSGTLSGRLTIASKNHIYITGNLLYNDSDDDMLGLVAEQYVYILHFWRAGSTPPAGAPPYGSDVAPADITINAAIYSANKSFAFESHASGSAKGTINLTGSIAQLNRGAVGTFSGSTRLSGYSKNYNYDPRMLYSNPPHFIEPLNSGFQIVSWEELPADQ